MRKRCHRTRRPVSAPMLVNRGLVNTDLETRERMAVEAFCLGFATTEHYDQVADMREFCTTYRDYWLRQPVTAYENAVAMLDRARLLNQKEVEIRA